MSWANEKERKAKEELERILILANSLLEDQDFYVLWSHQEDSSSEEVFDAVLEKLAQHHFGCNLKEVINEFLSITVVD